MRSTSIREWFARWEQLIGDVDFDGARELFDDDVVGFGSVARAVRGIDELEERQWRSVWGRTTDFRFDLDHLDAGESADGLNGWGACSWTSTGRHPDGTPFDRPGRCTVVLRRAHADDAWRAVHTHFSLAP